MNEVKVFGNEEFGSLRAIEIDGEPWFVGKDVAEMLGYAKARNAIAAHVDEGDALSQGIADNLGRTQEMTFINESGMYSLILSSKLPSAKRFKHWVTSEVLPSIRKHGGYSVEASQKIGELSTKLESVSANIEALSDKVSKIDTKASYTNYYMRLQMRSGYDEKWERRQSKNLKAIAEFIGTDQKQLLRSIYNEMEIRYGITLNKFCNDYKYTKKVSTCSTLSVISFSLTLREMFDAVVGEVLEVCGIEPAEGCGESPLIDMVRERASSRENEA